MSVVYQLRSFPSGRYVKKDAENTSSIIKKFKKLMVVLTQRKGFASFWNVQNCDSKRNLFIWSQSTSRRQSLKSLVKQTTPEANICMLGRNCVFYHGHPAGSVNGWMNSSEAKAALIWRGDGNGRINCH